MFNSEFPLPLLYLGISGVLHPSEGTYRAMHGSALWRDGQKKYEDVPIRVDALAAHSGLSDPIPQDRLTDFLRATSGRGGSA